MKNNKTTIFLVGILVVIILVPLLILLIVNTGKKEIKEDLLGIDFRLKVILQSYLNMIQLIL